MTTFKDAKVGDKVWSLSYGYGKIDELRRNCDYEIIVKFEKCRASFTKDGKSFKEQLTQSLFWNEVIIVPPEKPLPKIEVDTKVLVWDTSHTEKTKAYFSHFDKHGKAVTFRYGKTSWSRNNDETLFTWQHWELAKDDNCK